MNKRYNFTLVELLVVIGIISILAGLVLGAVSLSQSSARNTQAKSDMASIILALRGVETTYGKLTVFTKDGGDNGYKYGGFKAVVLNTSDTGDFICLGQPGDSSHSSTSDTASENAYDAFIAELSVPKAKELKDKLNINKRRVVFLEPKAGFDPSKAYNDNAAQKAALWRDPWGNRYTIFINVSGTKHLQIPEVKNKTQALGDKSFNVATDIAIYSHGPNGVDNGGCHSDLNVCINHADRSNHKFHDDVASWHK